MLDCPTDAAYRSRFPLPTCTPPFPRRTGSSWIRRWGQDGLPDDLDSTYSAGFALSDLLILLFFVTIDEQCGATRDCNLQSLDSERLRDLEHDTRTDIFDVTQYGRHPRQRSSDFGCHHHFHCPSDNFCRGSILHQNIHRPIHQTR